MSDALVRPALDYFGGKWKHASRIIETFPEHKTFVDVFCGAASITLRKPRSKNEIINDINDELVNFFRILRDRNHDLKCVLEKTPYSRQEYYACREVAADALEQARRSVVKSWFGISDSLDNETGFRVSLSQGGSTTKPWLTYVDYLHTYANRLRGVIIENLDFAECIRRYDKPDTLFYLDPPYVRATRSKKNAYKHDWHDEDHSRLLTLLPDIKGHFVLSGYAHESYSLPYRKVTFTACSQQGKRTEFLWIKSNVTNKPEGPIYDPKTT